MCSISSLTWYVYTWTRDFPGTDFLPFGFLEITKSSPKLSSDGILLLFVCLEGANSSLKLPSDDIVLVTNCCWYNGNCSISYSLSGITNGISDSVDLLRILRASNLGGFPVPGDKHKVNWRTHTRGKKKYNLRSLEAKRFLNPSNSGNDPGGLIAKQLSSYLQE